MAGKITRLSIAGLAAVALACAARDFRRPEELTIFDAVGVCPARSNASGWDIVWHPQAPGVDPAATLRLFRHLAAPDFERCLRTLLTSESTLAARLRELAPTGDGESDVARAAATMRAVQERWRSFGVEAALEEVAVTGTRGERVDQVLDACASLDPG